ncbi:MAG: choice-of-anchor tandem repeat GloVer-containing protein [Terriglobales bacterium]
MKSNHRQPKHSDIAAMLLTMFVAVVMFAGVAVPAQAQTFTSLYSFQGTASNYGAYPQGLVQGTDGNLYGVTAAGGAEFDSGVFFKISTSGNEKLICSFYDPGACRDAQAPSANLVEGTNGDFYGVALDGEIIRLTTKGKLKVLYTNANAVPRASLILASNGDFYGTTVNGGANSQGNVFKMTAAGKLTTLYSFCSVYQNGACQDGAQPNFALVEGSDGNVYGTTSIGGNDGVNDGYGTIFKITLAGALTTIYNFPGFTQSSSALIQGADGNFYGTTADGGSGAYGAGGTFFTVTPSGALTTLYNFCSQQNCTDGEQPANIYLATDGNFYGITWYGGVDNNNQGTIFQFTPSGTLTTLHNFDGTDGSGPAGGGTLTQDTNGTLYGTMLQGGISWPCDSIVCVGTIFSLDMGLGPFVETLPTSGKVKAKVKILGTDLTGATSVTFNGTAATFTVASSSEITTNVPEGATTGVVKVVTAGGTTLISNSVFQVP